jgi:hypothetical protein
MAMTSRHLELETCYFHGRSPVKILSIFPNSANRIHP